MSLLEVEALSVFAADRRGELAIVDRLSLTLDAGASLAIVGESGSGKTQAALALLGLQAPGLRVAGSARFDGVELIGAREAQLNRVRGARVGFVFQDPGSSLNPYLPIGRQIAEVLEVHRGASHAAAIGEARRLLDRVRIADAARRLGQYPYELSGGMRQRVMIAIALAAGPQLLIADEPTTALDVTVQQQLVELLRELRRELSLALLLITHDLGLVAELCARTLILYAGRVMEQGASAALLEAPTHPYTQALLRARPRMDADPATPLFAIRGALTAADRRAAACRFAARCDWATAVCRESEPPLQRDADAARRCHRRAGEIRTQV